MPPAEEQAGALFSRVYLQSPTAQRDSPRFRKRVCSWHVQELLDSEVSNLIRAIHRELGIDVPSTDWGVMWGRFYDDAQLRDVLDVITLIYRVLGINGRRTKANELRAFAARVFQEESLGYVMNDQGAIRYGVDAEYERNRFSAIDGLGDARYGAVKDSVERSFSRLDRSPDTKTAVREMFEAAEILAKLMAATNEDLDVRMVQSRIKPIAQRLYANDPSAASFADQMLEGFAKWVNAGHKYRHGQQTEDPVAPPLDMAVAYLSAGASHIRFLVSIDAITRMLG